MTTTNNLGLYLHIPFCVRKCSYCDFLSFGCNDNKLLTEYTQALMEEIKIKAEDWHYRKVDSIFIGGGTPSLLSEADISKLLDCIRDNFNVDENAEITIEVNPATVSPDKLEKYLNKGINRLSIGVQSFENHVLQILGRIHSKNDAFNCIQKAQKAGFKNINVDIMFGIPGQSMKMWKDTVRQAIFLRPTHISLYSLQIEEGTEMYSKVYETEEYEPVSVDVDREMYHTALRMMRTAGYEHYEISNAALPGYESKHNMKYWSYDEYLGLGLGASSFADGVRYKNCESMYDYIQAIKKKTAPIDAGSIEKYSRREEMGIFAFTGLRKAEGVDLRQFKSVFGVEFFDVYDKRLVQRFEGKLVLEDDRLFLTENGMDVSNRIMAEFI
ncbi:MAG: radical SAM family heme chaperone HemW [Bacillota bacterium]|nr:radical SAM family heme chaperone HemW [Bacillota bacterium]